MRHTLLLFVVLIFACKRTNKANDQIEQGVSIQLAKKRTNTINDVTYDLHFTIPNDTKTPITAHENLTFEFVGNDTLYLDFKEETDHLKKILVNGTQIIINHKNEHIAIPAIHLTEGKNTIAIDFLAGELSLNRNEDYLYTLLVPDRARTLFPCFDQPNLKATYTLKISAPETWKLLCAAPELDQITSNGFTEHQFGESDKMSTYLFSFVAGKFESKEMEIANFPMKMLYRETDEEKIKYSIDSIFQLHHNSKKFLENYTDFPFPFQKLDFATIPGFQYGGMEHVGAIQYKESSLFLDASATENRKLGRAKLIAHETSHMWFGDLVTMDWFNDVWMKEVFANFMADKIVNPAFPSINHELSFAVGHYPSAYGEDRTKGTNPIRQELENLNNAGSLYGSIIYNKAPIMMRQLEALLGKETFQKGIQEYIKTYQNSNANWNDLVKILDNLTDMDLLEWSDVWVNRSGRPIFKDSISYTPNGSISSLELRQMAEDGSDHIWPQIFEISLIYADTIQRFPLEFTGNTVKVTEAIGLPKPLAVFYNWDGMGYGVFPIHPEVFETITIIDDEVARGSLYINAYETTLNGTMEPLELLSFYENRLYLEENELLSNLLSGYLRSLFWKYLTVEERRLEQSKFTDNLWSQLQKDLSPNNKKTLFSTFQMVAYTGASIQQLYDIWSKKIEISNLRLNKDDFTEMALHLALYEHPKSAEILEQAKNALDNPDKLERFNFLLPSVSQDASVKSSFMESLKYEKNRSKEAWTASALNNINHPLHQEFALKHIRASLDLLDEIQKTGDIFFPKRWLSNSIGNHTSPEAYQIMQDYLKENPELNPSLKNKLWQAADDLRRVQLLGKNVKL
ncbi:M1 family metallopeptidase [Maribacter sp. 4G9]|uniref:M1 family metallopeptidase n=1 Tax=Maribacter sp. 4G9 TaxID=1889777 RepID=UPI000C146A05|nr:M1 family aminopeptidase [Maribacter sp. 4G9]PIB26913.1 peptidase M1 [Maribacter sp. 4G9]